MQHWSKECCCLAARRPAHNEREREKIPLEPLVLGDAGGHYPPHPRFDFVVVKVTYNTYQAGVAFLEAAA